MQVFPSGAADLLKHMKEKEKIDLSKVIMSPMPGVVKAVSVEVGQVIGDGAECCIVEAMKMQNSMKAAAGGKVKSVNERKVTCWSAKPMKNPTYIYLKITIFS